MRILAKRAALALIALRFIDEERLDGAFELGMQQISLPLFGFDDLLGTCDDIRSLHAYASAGGGAPTISERVERTAKIVGRESAPPWEIDWDEYEDSVGRA